MRFAALCQDALDVPQAAAAAKERELVLKRKLEPITIVSKHVLWLISHLQQELLFMFPCTKPAVLLAVP